MQLAGNLHIHHGAKVKVALSLSLPLCTALVEVNFAGVPCLMFGSRRIRIYIFKSDCQIKLFLTCENAKKY